MFNQPQHTSCLFDCKGNKIPLLESFFCTLFSPQESRKCQYREESRLIQNLFIAFVVSTKQKGKANEKDEYKSG